MGIGKYYAKDISYKKLLVTVGVFSYLALAIAIMFSIDSDNSNCEPSLVNYGSSSFQTIESIPTDSSSSRLEGDMVH